MGMARQFLLAVSFLVQCRDSSSSKSSSRSSGSRKYAAPDSRDDGKTEDRERKDGKKKNPTLQKTRPKIQLDIPFKIYIITAVNLQINNISTYLTPCSFNINTLKFA